MNISGSWRRIVSEGKSNLWEEVRNILFQIVDSPVLELPGATVVPGATPVVPKTQNQLLSPCFIFYKHAPKKNLSLFSFYLTGSLTTSSLTVSCMYFPKTFRGTMFSTWGNLLATLYFGKLVGFLLYSPVFFPVTSLSDDIVVLAGGWKWKKIWMFWKLQLLRKYCAVHFFCVCDKPTSIIGQTFFWFMQLFLTSQE